jgi:hypothetical protein
MQEHLRHRPANLHLANLKLLLRALAKELQEKQMPNQMLRLLLRLQLQKYLLLSVVRSMYPEM